jgi:hypothetical protein
MTDVDQIAALATALSTVLLALVKLIVVLRSRQAVLEDQLPAQSCSVETSTMR